MTQMRLAILLSALLIPAPGSSEAQTETIRSLLERPEVALDFAGEIGPDSALGIRMSSGKIEGKIEALTLEPKSGALRAGKGGAGDIAFPDIDDPTSGRIRFSSLTSDDIRALPLLLAGAECETSPVGLLAPVQVAFRDVAFFASRRMLPQGEVPERIEVPELEIGLRMDPGATCFILEEVSAKSVTAHGFDGSSFFLAELRALLRKGSFGAIAEFDLRGVSAMDAEREELLSLGLLRVRAKVDKHPDEITEKISGVTGMVAQAVKISEISDPEIDVSIRGLHLPLGKILPEAERSTLGLEMSSVVQGEVRFSLAAPGKEIVLTSDVNLSGVLRLAAEIKMQAPQTAPPAPPASLPGMDRFSALLPLLGLDLKSAHISIQDAGARHLIEAATGRSLEDDLIASLAPFGPIASQIEPAMRSWLREAFFLGAEIDLAPAEPVGLLRIGFQAAMDSPSLPELLGLTTGSPQF